MCVEKQMIQQTAERLENALDNYSFHDEQKVAISEAITTKEPAVPRMLHDELIELKDRNGGYADESQRNLLFAALSLVNAKQGHRTDSHQKRERLDSANEFIDNFYEKVKTELFQQIKEARYEFDQFAERLNACHETPDLVKVSRTIAFDVFFNKKPELNHLHEHLVVVHLVKYPKFLFVKRLWNELRTCFEIT